MSNSTVVVEDRQLLADLALQQYGSVEGMVNIMRNNVDTIGSFTSVPIVGIRLRVPGAPIDTSIPLLYTKINHKPVSLRSYSELVGDFNDDFNNDLYI